jgi:hypothetical protein
MSNECVEHNTGNGVKALQDSLALEHDAEGVSANSKTESLLV